MIKVGELGTAPILDSIDAFIGDWLDSGLIVIDGHSIEVSLETGDGHVKLVLWDTLERTGKE